MLNAIIKSIAAEVIRMLTPELDAKFAELNQYIAAEKEEAQAVIKQAVAAAIKPLELEIAELKAAVAANVDPGAIIAKLAESIDGVKQIVTTSNPE
jgi:hypothetical protein